MGVDEAHVRTELLEAARSRQWYDATRGKRVTAECLRRVLLQPEQVLNETARADDLYDEVDVRLDVEALLARLADGSQPAALIAEALRPIVFEGVRPTELDRRSAGSEKLDTVRRRRERALRRLYAHGVPAMPRRAARECSDLAADARGSSPPHCAVRQPWSRPDRCP